MIVKSVKRWIKKIFRPSSARDSSKLLRILGQYQEGRNSRVKTWVLKNRIERLNYHNASSIPLSATISKNICFPHGLAGIFISIGAQIGDNCTIFQNVTIGSNTMAGSKHPGAPSIGHDVFIGVGAVILGGIHIGNHVRIGANTTVVEDVPDNCTVVAGGGVRIIPSEIELDNSFVGYNKWKRQRLDNKGANYTEEN